MTTNLKIALACITTLIAGVTANIVINDIRETDQLIKRGEAQREATKEIENMFAKDKKQYEELMKRLES